MKAIEVDNLNQRWKLIDEGIEVNGIDTDGNGNDDYDRGGCFCGQEMNKNAHIE